MDTPPDPTSVAGLFRRLATLDHRAFGEIVTRFRDRLLPAARRRLEREPELRGLYDEEDAFQSALERDLAPHPRRRHGPIGRPG